LDYPLRVHRVGKGKTVVVVVAKDLRGKGKGQVDVAEVTVAKAIGM
jgi:hypothetical protein